MSLLFSSMKGIPTTHNIPIPTPAPGLFEPRITHTLSMDSIHRLFTHGAIHVYQYAWISTASQRQIHNSLSHQVVHPCTWQIIYQTDIRNCIVSISVSFEVVKFPPLGWGWGYWLFLFLFFWGLVNISQTDYWGDGHVSIFVTCRFLGFMAEELYKIQSVASQLCSNKTNEVRESVRSRVDQKPSTI